MTASNYRRGFLALAIGISAPLAIASMLTGTPADAQIAVKTGCPNKIAAKCPKNFERVCSQTDNKGCCKKSQCVQK